MICCFFFLFVRLLSSQHPSFLGVSNRKEESRKLLPWRMYGTGEEKIKRDIEREREEEREESRETVRQHNLHLLPFKEWLRRQPNR